MKKPLSMLALIFSLLTSTFGQTLPQADTAQDNVVRITTNLVQIDVVVTDRQGNQVTDLQPEDFAIYEDGRLREIKNFSYFSIQPAINASATEPNATSRANKNVAAAPPSPPTQLRRDQVRRTIALVVDDLGLSFESMHFVRDALRKFVDEQMQPNDLVAIIRTGAGVGALQQFTTDKQLLRAAIDRIKFNFLGRSNIAAFAAIEDDPLYAFKNRPAGDTGTSADLNAINSTNFEKDARNSLNNYRDEIFSVGTLGALNFVVRGLRELPGRKSVVLMSDGIALFDPAGDTNYRTLEAVRRLTDLANRASVVIYTIDARGLPPLNLTSSDTLPQVSQTSSGQLVRGSSGRAIEQQLAARDQEFFTSQGGLSYLAQQTGGFFVFNNNDINQGIRRTLDDQKGYYLIGYRPDESTFDPITGRKKFHNITVRLTRPGLTVRTRTGFYGFTNSEARAVYQTRAAQLLAAITSPFASGAIDMRLTSVFFNDENYRSLVRSLIYVDGKSLTFVEQPDTSRKAVVDVLAMTFGDDGLPIDQRFRTETIVVRGDEYRDVLRNGLIFGINLPLKQPGAFQLRLAVRDAASERVGSANQFIEVPNLKKNRLTLSGLYVGSSDRFATVTNTKTSASSNSTAETATAEGNIREADPQAGVAVRRFRAGATIDYGYEVYNARLDKATHRQQLQTQVRLFRDNRQVFAGKIIDINGQLDTKRLVAVGHLPLGKNTPSGEYILQVVVIDTLAKEKQRIATQWTDFEIK